MEDCLCFCVFVISVKLRISLENFLPLLVTFSQISAMNSSGQLSFSSAPFELFGRNFGYLATLLYDLRLHGTFSV